MDTLFLEGPRRFLMKTRSLEARDGALVLSVLGVHTQDFTSGDFSLSAPQTLAIGDRASRDACRATISGNLFEIFRSPDLALVRFPGEHTPGLLCRCRLDPV
jgi:PmbA protein